MPVTAHTTSTCWFTREEEQHTPLQFWMSRIATDSEAAGWTVGATLGKHVTDDAVQSADAPHNCAKRTTTPTTIAVRRRGTESVLLPNDSRDGDDAAPLPF